MNSGNYEYVNAWQLTDSGGYARISSNSNNTAVDTHKSIHRKRYKRGGRRHAVHINENDPLAVFLNSRSLQQVKTLLSIMRIKHDEELPLTAVNIAIGNNNMQVNLNELIEVMNDDLQDWAYGLIDDKQAGNLVDIFFLSLLLIANSDHKVTIATNTVEYRGRESHWKYPMATTSGIHLLYFTSRFIRKFSLRYLVDQLNSTTSRKWDEKKIYSRTPLTQ
ncbi:unnamed protein product, partial [Toxocara canis]|uniref:ULP_PROTEASE domain-containing protein n=1 Tax=Toxocara canis TaxID=6265 RepID=A0A183UJI9_TOXCA